MIIRRCLQTVLFVFATTCFAAAQTSVSQPADKPAHEKQIIIGKQTVLKWRPLTNNEAQKRGYDRQVFAFGEPSLDFETFIPKDGQVKVLPFRKETVKEGDIARIVPLGQIRAVQNNVTVENSIFSYQLRFPPAAMRTCKWQMTQDGFFVFHAISSDELADAQIFGVLADKNDESPQQARIAYCYARGSVLVAHYFTVELPKDTAGQEKAVTTLVDTASIFASNIRFANGEPNGLDEDQISHIGVRLGNDTMPLAYPKGLDVVINNADQDALPHEIHIVQKLHNQKLFSHLFVGIDKAKEKPSEDSLRRQAEIFAEYYVSSQIEHKDANNTISKKFVERNTLPGFVKDGIMARSYLYQIIEKANPDHPTSFYISVINHKGLVYIVYYHSLRSGNTDMGSEYFTGSVGDVAYDMLRDSIHKFLITQK